MMNYKLPSTLPAPEVEQSNTSINSNEDRARHNGFICTVSYVNGCPFSIAVTERTGLSVAIKPAKNINTGFFYIYVNYKLGSATKLNPYSIVNLANEELPDDLKVIKVCLNNTDVLNKRVNEAIVNFEIVYKVPISLLKENENCIHIEQLGLTLSLPKEDEVVVNPESQKGRFLLDSMMPEIAGFSLRVEINDPNQTYGARYINIGGKVFKISPTKDKSKQEGVYLYTSSFEIKSKDPNRTRYDLSEAEQSLRLYKTFEEAYNNGNIELERNIEYEEAKHSSRMQLIEAEKEKNVMAQQQNILKTVMDRVEASEKSTQKSIEMTLDFQAKLQQDREEERKRREKEDRERKQEEREYHSQERKEKLEYIKWCTAAAGAVTAAILVFKKLTSD